MMNIGIIGPGAMGSAIAKRLSDAGHAVCSWSRSGVEVEGVSAVDKPELAMQGDVTLTLLSDDAAIRDVLFQNELLSKANPSMVHVVVSTISVSFAQELDELHLGAGIAWIAAPVLGRPDVAAQGELNVLVAGSPEAVTRSEQILGVISKRIWNMGEKPSAAYAAKIACNMMITMAIEAMAEAVVITEANGLDRERFFDLILNTLFGSRSYQVYSRNIASNTYEPGFKASLGLKDLRLARQASDASGSDLPMLQAVYKQMLSPTVQKWVFRNLGGSIHARGLITLRLSSSNPARPYI